MFKLNDVLYYILKTPLGYQAKFELDDGLHVQAKIAKLQEHIIIHQGKLLHYSLADIVIQEVNSANLKNQFNPYFLETRLREIY